MQSHQLAGSDCVQALARVVYDLLNELGLAAGLGANQAEKRFLFETPWSATDPGDGRVRERACGDYTVIAWALNTQRQGGIRFPGSSFTAVKAFWHSAEAERVVTGQTPGQAQALVNAPQVPAQVRLRRLKGMLPSGAVQVLGTPLLERQAYPGAEFKQVYGGRWGEATYFHRVKNIFELERFSGTGLSGIQQDFYGGVFLATLDRVLSNPAQAALNPPVPAGALPAEVAVGASGCPKVNRAVSYLAEGVRVSA